MLSAYVQCGVKGESLVGMMKKNILIILLALGGALAITTGYGEEQDAQKDAPVAGTESVEAGVAPAAQATSAEELSPVAASLATQSFFNGKPDLHAKYYIYLQSASWCGPCRAEMPEIVALYEQMKKDGVEIILVSADSTQEGAEKYLQAFKAPFPATMPNKDGMVDLPGFKRTNYVPRATIVTNQGESLADGHGSIIKHYKDIIGKYEAQKAPGK